MSRVRLTSKMRKPIESVKLGKLPGTPCLPFVMRLACKWSIRRLSWTDCSAYTILRWWGQIPLYLPLIVCNSVMNTILRIMNFTNAMPCICARSPSFGTSHFEPLFLSNLACTLVTNIHIILVLSYRFAFPRWQSVSETWLKLLL